MATYEQDLQECREVAFLLMAKCGTITEALNELKVSNTQDPKNADRVARIRRLLQDTYDDILEIGRTMARYGQGLRDNELANTMVWVKSRLDDSQGTLRWLITRNYLRSDDFQRDLDTLAKIVEIITGIIKAAKE